MPLDQTNWKQDTETKPDLSKPSLEGLSWLLRHLPANHIWDFRAVGGKTPCGSAGCAIGLADAVWGMNTFRAVYYRLAPESVLDKLFIDALGGYGVPHSAVTPTMVADRIDSYLAETRK